MIKRLLLFLFFISCAAYSETINWYVDGETYATTNCNAGDDILLPTPPTKPGQVFMGWVPYQQIEYIESTGTQWIDTGYEYLDNTTAHVVIDTAILSTGGFWRTHGLSGSAYGGPSVGINNSSYLSFASNGDNVSNTIATLGVRYLFDLDMPNSTFKVSNVDNNNVVIVNMSGINNSYSNKNRKGIYFVLFGYRDSAVSATKNASRVYSAKLYDNDVLVRDMIPVLDENDTPCMFDKVTEQFFYNVGSGNFIAGPLK